MRKWLRKLGRWLASTTSNPASWFVDWIRGDTSDSGVPINGKACLKYAPVWNAVNRICGRVAQLPVVLYEEIDDRTKRRAVEHPAYRLMRRTPNSLMTPATLKELLQYHALIYGNGRGWIERNKRAEPVAIVPLLPDRTKTVLVNGQKWHISKIEVEPGIFEDRKFPDRDVIHIIGLGHDGIAGFPLWELAKNSWGLGLGAEKQGNRLFKNSNVPGLILEAPPGTFPDDDEAHKFLTAFRSMHEGVENSGKTALLREGIKASKLAQTAQESQAIEQRKFQRQDAALWFLLESMLGDDSSVSYKSLEQKQLAELINCLNPWLVKWQEQLEAKLLREYEKAADSHFFRFQTGALLRSDTKTTYETLTMGIRGMLITTNEAREVLDLPPIEGGDELRNPAISTDVGGEPDPVKESDDPDETVQQIEDRLRSLIGSRIDDLVATERSRVSKIVDGRSYNGNLGSFYKRWEATFRESIAPMCAGEDSAATIAAEWCQESLADLERDGDVAEILAGWDQRANGLADQLAAAM